MSVSVSVCVTSESKKDLIYVVTVHNSILVMLFSPEKRRVSDLGSAFLHDSQVVLMRGHP